jgi:uncharacterized protein YbjT (DUF2867 family)
MTNLLVIFGATGQQGTSVANKVLEDAQLSKLYRIRAITRDTSKPDAKVLERKGVNVVRADLDDRTSVRAALHGAHTVFLMTTSMYIPGGFEKEVAQGKLAADEAVVAGAKYLIYSTVPSAKKLTDGRYPVGSFDCKDEVKTYIESLPVKSAFFSPGCFMSNFRSHMGPRPGPDGRLAITNFAKPETTYPLIDIATDTGKFIGAILSQPEKYAGKTFCAATRIYTMAEIVETISKVDGKEIVYNQIPKDVYAKYLPEGSREALVNMHAYFEYCGYYGRESKELVEWAASNAIGSLTTLEEYLRREPAY